MGPLGQRLRAILIGEKHTDCCFIVDKRPMYSHKIILAAASPVLEAMFYGPFAAINNISGPESSGGEVPPEAPPTAIGEKSAKKQTCVTTTIIDISAKIWHTMIEYIYTDETDWDSLSTYDLLELYYCAEKYLLQDLVQMTLERILMSLNCNSLFLIYDFAIRFKLNRLTDKCRQMLHELLDKKPNLFFKKMLQVNCDDVIRCYETGEDSNEDEDRPAVKRRKPPVPIEFIEDIVFGGSEDEAILGQYHQVSKECLNDILVLNFDENNGVFNDNLLLFVLKWTKIEWKLQSMGQDKLPLKKIPLLNFFQSFVCHRRTSNLVENLISFLENHYYLNNVENIPGCGWHLMQRIDLKASRPLIISGERNQFVTKFQVNQLIAIKSLIINSRLNNQILSRFMRLNRQYVYQENLSIDIFVDLPETKNNSIHRQHFNLEAEFNSQCELFLNKSIYFKPDLVYGIQFKWPRDSALTIEYPRKIYESYQNMNFIDKQFSIVFVDDAVEGTIQKDTEFISHGGILQGIHFMFMS